MDASILASFELSWVCIILGTILVWIGTTLAWIVVKWVWIKPKRLEKCLRKQGFRGNPYRVLYGDTLERAQMVDQARSKPMAELSHDYLSRIIPFHLHTIKKYGKRCIIWNGPIPVVNILDPEEMREIFMKIFDFQKPNTNPFIMKLATGLIQLEGHKWAQHRKLINPAFHMEKLKVMLPAVSSSSYNMIKKWEEKTFETGGSLEVEVWSDLLTLSADVISRAAFGSSFEEGRRIFQLISKQLTIVIPLANSVYIPGSRFVPTKENRMMKEIDKEIISLIKGIIYKREKAINMGEKLKDDLLGILLESSNKGNTQLVNAKKRNNNTRLSFEDVINECKIFYLAGQETTSSLLVWTLIMLAKYQDWQSRAREEVLSIFGTNIPTDFHGLNHLKITNMILQEVLRLYSPVVEINRTVSKDTKVGDIFFPAGVHVSLQMSLVQQDEKLWGIDAKEFNPQRFMEGISKASQGNVSFFSFGWGPRICIGSNFALMEAKVALSIILQHFSFELSPSYAHAPVNNGTLRPQFGAQLILHKL